MKTLFKNEYREIKRTSSGKLLSINLSSNLAEIVEYYVDANGKITK